MSGDVVSKAGDVLAPDRIARAGAQASQSIDEMVRRNPLIVGAVGLAIGAVIASALPSTRQEDELLGRAADDVKRRAQEAALGGVESAKSVATEVYQAATDRAKQEGLSLDNAKEFAGQIGEKLKTAVANVSSDGGQSGDAGENSIPTTSGAAS